MFHYHRGRHEKQYRDAVADVRTNDPSGVLPVPRRRLAEGGLGQQRTCLGWPAPRHEAPPEPPGAVYPTVPHTSGALRRPRLSDVSEGGLDVASRFPNSTWVSVPNVRALTALGDRQGCAAGIVVRFMRSGGTTGDTSCVSEYGRFAPYPASPGLRSAWRPPPRGPPWRPRAQTDASSRVPSTLPPTSSPVGTTTTAVTASDCAVGLSGTRATGQEW